MIAREIQRLPGAKADPATQDASLLDEAERLVDEYLRKFFDATIRLRPILPEDLRRFATDELQRLFAYVEASVPAPAGSNELVPTELQDRLVSLVVSALRQNPRRIKQFANSLETRLRTIRAREDSGGISRELALSADILGIAKLAILEEEWRPFYEELERNPRRLAEAQSEAAACAADRTRSSRPACH